MTNTKLVLGVVAMGLVLIGIMMWGIPKYRVYRLDFTGQANLRQQEWEKKIIIEQAKAEKESAVLYAEAEVERAKGVAQANEIIGNSLEGNEEYLKYLWINNIQSGAGERIYIPTEANLPILEAK